MISSAKEFAKSLFNKNYNEYVRLIAARDAELQREARLAEAYRVLYEVTKVWERNRATPLIFHDWLRIEFDMKEAMIRAPGDWTSPRALPLSAPVRRRKRRTPSVLIVTLARKQQPRIRSERLLP